MRRKVAHRRSDCPISYALDLFGDKWTLLIIRDLMIRRKRRYGEFAESGEKIATNILADRLARLEKEGFVTRNADPENRRQLIYTPTPKALDLAPVLVELILWSARHDPDTGVDPGFVRKAKANRDRVVKSLASRDDRQPRVRILGRPKSRRPKQRKKASR